MKNVVKTLGIISMVLIIGFSMAACDNGTTGGGGGNGTLTLTGIPSQYNGCYVIFQGTEENGRSLIVSTRDNDPGRIANGSATIPAWMWGGGYKLGRSKV